ncbi:hypothetical protein [Bacillus sp. AFS040349]|uniref:hypothetical protein n=1 Tax=Bacillus sp. AFS040349 TaxID=2033502 RepID=UPI000BFBBDC7|nr:hypothetical protein [Bacillus sp. AFS040349]PGT83263.1 hypothetical protein COD11_13085 [Bacillus sp. AFS040349]
MNSTRIEALLIEKGVSQKELNKLKNRRVVIMNSQLYETQEEINEVTEIPTSKIVSTHRTLGSCRSWWDNIFDERFNNIDDDKWKRIYNIFERESLQEFRNSLSYVAKPLESATYYPEYDVYKIGEGHHRTCWSLLTGTPVLKVARLSIVTFSEQKLSERKERLSDISSIYNSLICKEGIIKGLVEELNLVLIEGDIKYREHHVCQIDTIDVKKAKESNKLLLHGPRYEDQLIYAISYINNIMSEHNKIKHYPKFLREKILAVKTFLFFTKEKEALQDLYQRGWSI